MKTRLDGEPKEKLTERKFTRPLEALDLEALGIFSSGDEEGRIQLAQRTGPCR